MGAGEVARRVHRAVRDRLFPSQYTRLSAEEAFDHFFLGADPLAIPALDPRVPALIALGPEPPEDPRRFDLFGHQVVLDDPPDWARNYAHGGVWPDAPARKLDLRRTDFAGGVKYVWEPSRHHMLSALAYRYATTGDEAAAAKLAAWLEDWIDRNPLGRGIHWTSPLEMAVRIHVWTWCLGALRSWPGLSDRLARKVVGSMAQQAAHIAENLSLGSSANNHLIGEACALAFFGRVWPGCRHADPWRMIGDRIAEEECLRQIHPDGVPAEQAFGYLPFVWEFYLQLALAGWRPPPAVLERLDRSVRFIGAASSHAGYVPQVGDEDDGAVLRHWGTGWGRYPAVAEGLRMVLGTSGLEPPEPGTIAFEQGGYTVFRGGEPEMVAVFDHGPLGLGSLAAHGHADALSLTLSIDDRPVLVDPGAYSYHEEPEWRRYFRSTRAHNTVCIGGRDQSEMLGPFLWGRRCTVRRSQGKEHTYQVFGAPFYRAIHERQVQFGKGRVTVVDTVSGPYESAVAHWHLHPEVEAEKLDGRTVALAWDGRRRATLSLDFEPAGLEIHRGDAANAQPGPGWYSPSYGRVLPTTTIAVTIPARARSMATSIAAE
jgi:hypothetical protein